MYEMQVVALLSLVYTNARNNALLGNVLPHIVRWSWWAPRRLESGFLRSASPVFGQDAANRFTNKWGADHITTQLSPWIITKHRHMSKFNVLSIRQYVYTRLSDGCFKWKTAMMAYHHMTNWPWRFTQTIGCPSGNLDNRVLKLIICDGICLDTFWLAVAILPTI